MSQRFLQFAVDPESRGIEAQHAGAAGSHPDGMSLRIKTLEPRLAQRILRRQQQGYGLMLACHTLIGIFQDLLQFIIIGGRQRLWVEGVKNRVADHAEIRGISGLKPGNRPQRRIGLTERTVRAVNQLVVLVLDFDILDPGRRVPSSGFPFRCRYRRNMTGRSCSSTISLTVSAMTLVLNPWG